MITPDEKSGDEFDFLAYRETARGVLDVELEKLTPEAGKFLGVIIGLRIRLERAIRTGDKDTALHALHHIDPLLDAAVEVAAVEYERRARR